MGVQCEMSSYMVVHTLLFLELYKVQYTISSGIRVHYQLPYFFGINLLTMSFK